MDFTQMLMKIAIGGCTWVLLLLVILSILSIALIVEKSLLYSRFYPAMEKGMPILCLVRIPIRFELID